MKVLLAVFLFAFSTNTFATVDAMTTGWIVTQNFNDEEDFSVMPVAISGCYGVSYGPQLEQFTADYNVASSMGCGMTNTTPNNINALTCAKVVSSEESADYSSLKKFTLDISKCDAKNNKKFITMIRTAAKRNFPQTIKGKITKKKEVELVLIK